MILSDTSGSVFVLDTRKKDFDSQCIFSGRYLFYFKNDVFDLISNILL